MPKRSKDTSVLVVVPHGDDEVLGFAGAIQYFKKQRAKVVVHFSHISQATDRKTKQFNDIQKSMKILKYQMSFNSITAWDLDGDRSNVLRFEKLVNEHKPDYLFIPHPGDSHQDHVNLHNTIRSAVRVNKTSGHIVPKILLGEIISSTDNTFNISNNFNPNFYIPMDLNMMDNKCEALQAYSGEVVSDPHPRSSDGLWVVARKRGQECGQRFAEAFQLMRWIA